MRCTDDDEAMDVDKLQTTAWALLLALPAIVIAVCWLAPFGTALS